MKANMIEMFQIINSEHADPHNILGQHIYEGEGTAVRVFIPQAKAVKIKDLTDGTVYEAERLHVDGFYELILEGKTAPFDYEVIARDYVGNEWATKDPYSFPLFITEFDMHLFNKGTHYEIFEKLGAHPMTMNGTAGVGFAVWAPNARRVSVVGDFNLWDGRRCPMRHRENSGIWELFIPAVQVNDIYKFEIKTQYNEIVLKTDPYGNFFELRPNTAAVVCDLNKYAWNDQAWMVERDTFAPNRPVSIYEVHLGSWRQVVEEGGRSLTYLELADQLIAYAKEMGYTHIELMPVEEHPFDGSWGYQVTGYYAPTSRFGTPDEFKQFVDRCHQNGIGVILDWVPAHFPKDAFALAKFDGTSLYEHSDPRKGEHPDWGTLIFNYGRNEVRNFLIANAIFWIDKYHIDGLRVDAVASMLYLDYGKKDGEWVANEYGGKENIEAVEFLKHMNSVILGKHPGALMIAEESTSWAGVSHDLQNDGLGFRYKWNMGWMNDFLRYMSKDPVHRKYHHNDLTFSMIYAYTERFILVLSHDEVVHGKGSMIGKMPGDMWQKFANLRLAYGFMFSHPGKKLMFMGSEFAQFSEWSEARSLDWHLLEYDSHKEMHAYVRDLNHLYQELPALWAKDFEDDGFEWINGGDWQASVISFARKAEKDEDTILAVCNFTPVTYEDRRVGVPFAGTYTEIFNSDDEKYGGAGVVNTEPLKAEKRDWDGKTYSIGFRMPPLGITIFKVKPDPRKKPSAAKKEAEKETDKKPSEAAKTAKKAVKTTKPAKPEKKKDADDQPKEKTTRRKKAAPPQEDVVEGQERLL